MSSWTREYRWAIPIHCTCMSGFIFICFCVMPCNVSVRVRVRSVFLPGRLRFVCAFGREGNPHPTRRSLTGFQCLWWAPRQYVGRIGRGPGAGRDCVHAAPRPRRTSIKVGNPLPRISASPLCPPEWMQQSPRLGGWAGVCWGSCSRSFWSSIPVLCPRPLAIRGGQYRVELSIPPETGPAQTLDVTPESPLFGEWELVAPHRASCTSPPRLGSARLYVFASSVPTFGFPGPGYVCMLCFERCCFCCLGLVSRC